MRILITEDDAKLAKTVNNTLVSLADIDIAETGEKALELLDEKYYDLIILDVMLPGMDGLEVLKRVRKQYQMPVLILSAVSDVDRKVEFLNEGADDYIEKPFSRDELIARVEANLRRGNISSEAFSHKFKNLEINYTNKMVYIDGKLLDLNRKTYEILELLVRNKELIMTKQQIFDRIWGYYSDTVPTVVEVNISRLRKTFAGYGLDEHIRTIKSIGYMWTEKAIDE